MSDITNPLAQSSEIGAFFQKDTKAQTPIVKTEFTSQLEEVKALLRQDHLVNEDRLDQEVNWFYGGLGIDRYYFTTHSAKEIAGHIVSLYAAKCLSQSNGTEVELHLQSSQKGRALFAGRSMPGNRISPCVQIEQTIEENYFQQAYQSSTRHSAPEPKEIKRWRLQCYRTEGAISPTSAVYLRLYFLSEPNYASSASQPEKETDIEKIADKEFLRSLDANRKNLVQEMITEATNRLGPVIRVTGSATEEQKTLLILYTGGSTHSFFSGITDLYHSLNLFSPSKYVEHFSNGLTLFCVNLESLRSDVKLNQEKINEIIEQANLVYILPRTSLSPLVQKGTLTMNEHAYAYSAWKFAFQFLRRQSTEFADLANALKNDPVSAAILDRVKSAIRREAYTEGRILDAIIEYPHLVKDLYKNFEKYHLPRGSSRVTPGIDQDLVAKIKKMIHSELDQQIFGSFLAFNQHVLKTNFYKPTKVAISFRLNPTFLAETYPAVPFGVFFMVGAEFRGYHIRFRDIARGGIRIIRSTNFQAFTQNVVTLFDENYNLAATQDRKNKDIPEGGSKGTILLSADHQDKSFPAFKKYVDCLLDLLSPDEAVVDHYGKEEILFMGPDEGTADMMNWASQHAKERGFKFWKAFTTGKSRERGGIPHDLYGMTTRSIHQYVLGILSKMNLNESNCTKFQTGGPDGDLGSNEIKISKDKTIAIVDGSGVLYDPNGIDKEELRTNCAMQRKMAKFFDRKKLSPKGFFVDVEQNDITLPDGTVIQTGLEFRNQFHLNPLATADIFVPCGGRPESVNLSNVHHLVDKETKKPRFKIIVEGANLFFTQEARLFLEKHGVVIFKDASANKGGVTSSSLEVLAALSLTDEEFEKHMAVKGTDEPEFYRKYVEEVQQVIEGNARLEFECIWNESQKSPIPRSILSDTISFKIVELSAAIAESDLWNDEHIRKRVLLEACPKILLNLLQSVDTLIERVPQSYLRAIFSRYLASRYVYKCGLAKNPEFEFFSFLHPFLQK